MMNFNTFIEFPRINEVDEIALLNNSAYSIINTATLKENSKKLFPYFLLNGKRDDKNTIRVITEESNSTINLTKLQILSFIGYRAYFTSLIKKTSLTNIYYFGKGIIQDINYNTLMCYCVDLSKVDFKKKSNLSLDAFYLLINSKLLYLPENKKLLSILNSKDSVIEHALVSGIDIIYTHNIDNKIFDSVDITFKSISDRKKYFEEKIQEVRESIKDVSEINEKKLETIDVDF